MRLVTVGTLFFAAMVAVSAGQMPTYGARVTVAKGVDAAKFKTYSWTKGGPSANKAVDGQIVAAVDRELKAVGLTKATSGKGDVLVTYYSLRRTDVNLKAEPDASGNRPEYAVGSLLVALLDPATLKRVVELRTDKPVDLNPAKSEAVVNSAVTELFAKYPTRQK